MKSKNICEMPISKRCLNCISLFIACTSIGQRFLCYLGLLPFSPKHFFCHTPTHVHMCVQTHAHTNWLKMSYVVLRHKMLNFARNIIWSKKGMAISKMLYAILLHFLLQMERTTSQHCDNQPHQRSLPRGGRRIIMAGTEQMEWLQPHVNYVFDIFDTIPLIPLQPLARARPPQLRCHQPPVNLILCDNWLSQVDRVCFDGLLLHVGIRHTNRIPISTQDLGLSINGEGVLLYIHTRVKRVTTNLSLP